MRLHTALLLLIVAAPARGQDEAARAVLEGRFLLPDGSPAAGVDLALHGWGANSQRVREFGVPRSWKDLTATTDAEGGFELRFHPPQAFQFTLTATLPGHGAACWRWSRIRPAETVALGEVQLVPAGDLVARIVDPTGKVLTDGWTVRAETELVLGVRSGRDETTVRSVLEEETGEFRLAGVPALRLRVEGHAESGLTTKPTWVEVRAGGETFVELVAEPITRRAPRAAGAPALAYDPARSVVLRLMTPPFYTLMVPTDAVTATGADGARYDRDPANGVFADLPDGTYRIVVDDPRFEPWTREGVRPGERLVANLRGAAAVDLEVVDATTGNPLRSYGLSVAFAGGNTWPNEFELRPDGTTAPPGPVEGLPATTLELRVRAPGRPEARVEVKDLQRGETREVRVAASRPIPIRGRVVEGEGDPEAGVAVEWTEGRHAGYAGVGKRYDSSGVPPAREVAHTDASGEFVLDGAGPGHHHLRVRWSPWLWVDRAIELPMAGELTFERPPFGWLEGRLLLPPPEEDVEVRLDVHAPDWFMHQQAMDLDAGQVELGEDGSFRVGPLPAGALDVELSVQYLALHSSSGKNYPIERVEIGAGETAQHVWDLRGVFPGRIALRASADGRALEDFRVEAVADDPDATRGFWGTSANEPGVVRMKGFSPAAWTLSLSARSEGWAYRVPTPVVVEASGHHELTVEVPFHARRVRFVDADGDPLADARVRWSMQAGDQPARANGVTDAEGTLLLRLTPGVVKFRRGKGTEPALVTWGPGEDVIEVRLR